MCFAVIAHHVPHTTVPANRPHRPVSAPLKRSLRAETGQPVRTQYGDRGRRLVRRLHPCAPAVRPPFDARLNGLSALKAWAFQKYAVPPRGTAGKGMTVRRKVCPGREEGPEKGSPDASRPAHGGPRQTMDGFGHEDTGWIGAASTRHWANWRAGRQASRQIVRDAAGWRVKFRIAPRRKPDVAWPSDQPCRQVLRPVTYAGMQTCKPPYGPEGKLPRLRAGLRAARAPRRSIMAAGILRKHEGFGGVLQLPAHPI